MPRHFKTRDHDARRAARHAQPAHRLAHSPEESYSSDEYDEEEEPAADDIYDLRERDSRGHSRQRPSRHRRAYSDDDDPEEQESFDSEEIID